MVTGHYNSYPFSILCLTLFLFFLSHLLATTFNMFTTALLNPAGVTWFYSCCFTSERWTSPVQSQVCRRVKLRLGFKLGTCYSVYLYIYIVFFLLPKFSCWHKQLKFATQSVWKELTSGKTSIMSSQCFLREWRKRRIFAFVTICDYMWLYFEAFCFYSLLPGAMIRQGFTPRSL